MRGGRGREEKGKKILLGLLGRGKGKKSDDVVSVWPWWHLHPILVWEGEGTIMHQTSILAATRWEQDEDEHPGEGNVLHSGDVVSLKSQLNFALAFSIWHSRHVHYMCITCGRCDKYTFRNALTW